MLTGIQVRLARHALRWSAERLAEQAGVVSKTIRRIEATDDVPNSTAKNLNQIKTVLESAGIEFIGTPEDRPGIRIGKPRR